MGLWKTKLADTLHKVVVANIAAPRRIVRRDPSFALTLNEDEAFPSSASLAAVPLVPLVEVTFPIGKQVMLMAVPLVELVELLLTMVQLLWPPSTGTVEFTRGPHTMVPFVPVLLDGITMQAMPFPPVSVPLVEFVGGTIQMEVPLFAVPFVDPLEVGMGNATVVKLLSKIVVTFVLPLDVGKGNPTVVKLLSKRVVLLVLPLDVGAGNSTVVKLLSKRVVLFVLPLDVGTGNPTVVKLLSKRVVSFPLPLEVG